MKQDFNVLENFYKRIFDNFELVVKQNKILEIFIRNQSFQYKYILFSSYRKCFNNCKDVLFKGLDYMDGFYKKFGLYHKTNENFLRK